MKTLLPAVLGGLMAVLATNAVYAEDVKFDDKGITFIYPKEWTVKTESKSKDLTTITVVNNKGTTMTITINGPEVDPKLIAGELDKTFKKVFEGKVVANSDQPSKRKLFGEEREGRTLEIEIVKSVTSKLEYYAFKPKSNKNTISVTLQTTSIDADAKKALDKIAESLNEK